MQAPVKPLALAAAPACATENETILRFRWTLATRTRRSTPWAATSSTALPTISPCAKTCATGKKAAQGALARTGVVSPGMPRNLGATLKYFF